MGYQLLNRYYESQEAGVIVAESIMTTDTKPKHLAVEIEVGGKTVTLGLAVRGQE